MDRPLGALLDARDDRMESGSPAFDVVPKHCLNRCQVGPIIEIRMADGNALLPKATKESIREAIGHLFD